MTKYRNSPVDSRRFNVRLRFDDKELVDEMNMLEVQRIEEAAGCSIDVVAGRYVLDIGCGYGSLFIESLKERGKEQRGFVHIDADQRVFTSDNNLCSIEKSKLDAYWAGDMKVCGDAHKLPFRDGKFDLVHMKGTLWDNEKEDSRLEAFVRTQIQHEIRRVLKQGGFYYGDDYIAVYKGEDIAGFKQFEASFPNMALYQKR